MAGTPTVLLPFTIILNLYLFKGCATGITATLWELIGGRITEVLPSLQNIFMEGLKPVGPLQKNIRRFIAKQELSSYPITISIWDSQDGD